MSTHDSFLQAMSEVPDDDTPCLIYADWLEEQGDPRSELLRLTVALGRGTVEPANVKGVLERLLALRGSIDPEWLERCSELWSRRPIEFLLCGLTVRSRSLFKRYGFTTVGELASRTPDELLEGSEFRNDIPHGDH